MWLRVVYRKLERAETTFIKWGQWAAILTSVSILFSDIARPTFLIIILFITLICSLLFSHLFAHLN